MKSVSAITLDCRPSPALIAATVAMVGLAWLSIALSDCAGWAAWLLALGVLLYAAQALRVVCAPRFTQLHWHAGGAWRLRDRHGRERVAELQRSVVLGLWIVLELRADSRRRVSIVLLPDNCAEDTRRRLRVRLASTAAASA